MAVFAITGTGDVVQYKDKKWTRIMGVVVWPLLLPLFFYALFFQIVVISLVLCMKINKLLGLRMQLLDEILESGTANKD